MAMQEPGFCRVVQVTMGRFNQFDLARQMYRHGMLERLIVGYPRWKMRNEGLPQEAINCFPYVTLLRSLATRTGLARGWLKRELTWHAQQAIDRYAARVLPDCDVVIALSGQGLRVGRAAQRRGIKYVCHRGPPTSARSRISSRRSTGNGACRSRPPTRVWSTRKSTNTRPPT
jgi:hypothetical protein